MMANQWSELAVISVLFNPVRYETRYKRFRKFKDHMFRSGVDLITVECIFPSAVQLGLPPQRFEVTDPNNPKDIQMIAPSILWMKENLINVAARRLPPSVRYVAWIDADVEFQRPDWPRLTVKTLQKFPIVQMFRVGFFAGPRGKNEILRKDFSFGYSIRHNKPIHHNYPGWYAHPGYAWAMHRSLFDSIGGLLDSCIVGSGDLHFAYGLLGRIDETVPAGMSKDYRQTVRQWGDRLAHVAQGGANVGYVDTDLFHQWHGTRENRRYVNRWSILIHFQFSPTKDLVRDQRSSIIGLKDKSLFDRTFFNISSRLNEMERAIVQYFISRNEDGRQVVDVPQRVRVRRRKRRHRRGFGPVIGGFY